MQSLFSFGVSGVLAVFSSVFLGGSLCAQVSVGGGQGGQKIGARELMAVLAGPVAEEAVPGLRRQILNTFGHEALAKNKAGAVIEETVVAWAALSGEPAAVLREDGKLLGQMLPVGGDGLQVLALELPNFSRLNYRVEIGGRTTQGGSLQIEHAPLTAASLVKEGVPKGELKSFEWAESGVFPKTRRQVTVYLPAGYEAGREVCLMVWQDGTRHAAANGPMRVPVVFDHLIHEGQMPPTVGVFIDPGRGMNQKVNEKAANRGFEYDSLGPAYSQFLLDELLPEVQRRYGVSWLADPRARAIGGGSSGGICAFTVAWERPDAFHKVLTWVGSFVDLRGGHAYPSLIRLTEPKPIRVYQLGGENDLDNAYGHWPTANLLFAAAMRYHAYDHHLEWTGCFHGSKVMGQYLPDALRWLWRDWQSDPALESLR